MTQARIPVTGDTVGLEGIRLTDAQLAAFVEQTNEDERAVVEADAGTSLTA